MTLALVFLVLLSLAAHGTQAAECLEPASRVVSRWKNGNYYKGEIESITNRVNVLFDNGARLAYNPRDNVDVVVDRIPDHTELPWGSRILVNRPKSRAFEIGYIRDIKNGRFVILYENGDLILHTLDQIRALNKSQICDEPAYLGCFRDNLPRDLQVYIPTHPATIGACVDTCKSSGFSVGALRNSDLCFCGNAYRKSNQVADKECDMPCYDNSFEVCGGFMTFSQYWTGIVDSPIGALPGIQKHFIPSNGPIPWELLMHARSKHPPRHMAGSTRGAPWYQAYSTPWKGTTNAASFQQQRISALGRFPSTYQVKPVYPPNRYQSYQSYYGAKPYTANYNGQLQQPSSRYGYQSGGTNTQPSMYGTYRSQANRWPYNYNYNNYKYRNYNFQNSAANRPYSGYQSAYQRRPAQRPSPQEHAKLMGMLKKVSWTLFKEITGTSKIALAAPRFLGCYQDSESRDLPTAIQVRPLTVEGCVSKCSESGFSIAGLQSSTQCFCGTTYSKYGRLQNDQCTMRCTGNYKEICGGVMMNSLYYTGVGQAVPYPTPSVDARAQQITFTKNTPLSYHTNEKPQPKPRPSSLKNPLSFHKVSLLKIRPKAFKSKDKTVKNKPKKPTQLKHKDVQDKGRPLAIQDYGKLTKILQTLSKWRQPHKIRYNNKDLQIKPTLSYKELRKILEDMTPEIVKKIANKIIAHDMNRTKLSDMKPLNAEKSLEVHLASTKVASGKDTGFKRVQVKSNNYRNWSKKGSSSAPKVRNKHEDIVQEDDAKPFSSSKNGVSAKATQKDTSEQRVSEKRDPNALSLGSTKEKDLTQSQSQNNTISSETQESTRYATQVVPKVQPLDGNKIPSLPSFIPIADKRKQDRKKSKHVHDQQNGRKQLQGPRKGLMSDVQSNKRTFVHFIVTESDDKKKKLPKTKNLSARNKTHFNETGNTDEGIVSNAHEKAKTHAKASIKNETKQNVTSQDNQTATEVVPSTMNSAVPSEDVDEVFETYSTPSNNTPVETEIKNSKNANVKTSNKTLTEKEVKPTKKQITHPQTGSKMLILKHPRIPHKVLHVEAKWNGQINVKANWKDVMEPETKPKKNSSVKKHNVNSKKKTAKKFKESSGDDEGSDEYKFDDSGSRNDLLWRHRRPLKDKIN